MMLDAYDRLPAHQFLQPYIPNRKQRWKAFCAERAEGRRQAKLRRFLASETQKGIGQTYQKYIHSDRWKRFARHIVLDRGSMCERCGKGDRLLTVHHLSYVRLGNELPEDVKVYCWPCHQLMHPEKIPGTST